MRTILVAAGLLGSSLLRFCDDSEEATKGKATIAAQAAGTEKATVRAQANAPLAPTIGGNLVSVGAHHVEVVLHQSGLIEAQVTLASGAAIANAAAAKLAVTVNGKGDARERVQLDWAPAQARFVGTARVQKQLSAGPIDVELLLDGKIEKAVLAQAAVLGAAEHGGVLIAAGDHAVELAAKASGEVEAHVHNAAGAALDGNAGIRLLAKLAAAGGATQDISLAWDAPRAAFAGRAEASAKLVPGPVEVNLTSGGVARVGGLAQFALAASATHGGRVLVAGNYSVELVSKGGLILAYVMDAAGKAYVAGDLDLKLATGANANLLTQLKWDAPSASYRAKLAGALDLEAQPVRLQLNVGGRSHFGGFGRFSANANAKGLASGDGAANAKASATLSAKAPAVNAQANLNKSAGAHASLTAAAPAVKISPPKVQAKVNKGANAGGSAKASFSFGTK